MKPKHIDKRLDQRRKAWDSSSQKMKEATKRPGSRSGRK